MRFSSRELRRRRKAAGLSPVELAVRTGVSESAIHRYEDGSRTPPVQRAAQLAAALGCTVDDLLTDDQEVVGS